MIRREEIADLWHAWRAAAMSEDKDRQHRLAEWARRYGDRVCAALLAAYRLRTGEHAASPRLVILESPYAGDVEANVAYARAALRDSLMRGEAPIASHLLYTQPGVLDDNLPSERRHGIDAGLSWGRVAEATVVYVDRGISTGMRYGIEHAAAAGRPVERRSLFARPDVTG